jgi:nucleoside-diphosphate-sugar epimerase/4-hydroxybenzoate polyprenyltransferase
VSSDSLSLPPRGVHLILGAAGFLGVALAAHLSSQGFRVIGVDLRPVKLSEMSYFDDFHLSDIESFDFSLVPRISYIHHVSSAVPLASSGKKFFKLNFEKNISLVENLGSLNFLRFIYYSSSAVSGRRVPSVKPLTESETWPLEEYGASKLKAENLFLSHYNERVLILRPRTILGPGRGGLFSLLFEKVRRCSTIILPGNPDIPYQFVHIQDLLSAVDVLLAKKSSGIFNVGGKISDSLLKDLKQFARENGSSSSFLSLPSGFVWILECFSKLGLLPFARWQYLSFSRPHLLDTTRLENLGWSAKFSNEVALQDAFGSSFPSKKNSHEGSVHQKSFPLLSDMSLFQSLRLHHWPKNFLIFIPIIFSKQLTEINLFTPLLAFVSWCMVSSSVYLLNDLVDVHSDRLHPYKNRRPLARGDLDRFTMVGISFILILCGGGLAPTGLLSYLLFYLALNLIYTHWAKRVPFLDLIFLTAFYLLRILSGFLFISMSPTLWLLLGAFLFFLGLSAFKRQYDLIYCPLGRGYGAETGFLLHQLGIFSWLGLSVLISFYIFDNTNSLSYNRLSVLGFNLIWLLFFYLRLRFNVLRGGQDSEFLKLILRDPVAYLCLFGVFATIGLAS